MKLSMISSLMKSNTINNNNNNDNNKILNQPSSERKLSPNNENLKKTLQKN